MMDKIRFTNVVIAFISVLITHMAAAQQIQLDTLIKKFEKYRQHNLNEKIYVHTDRSFYLTGETVWFNLYNTVAGSHKLMDISKVAYVEILDKSNTAVLQTKIELKEGLGGGAIFIPASLSSGNYLLRAYTSWMKNFSAEFYFQKPLSIVNPFVKLDQIAVTKAKTYSLQFFPEGGYLVDGLRSKVAFKLTSAEGHGVHLDGFVLNQNNDTISTFTPLRFGIGTFYLTPSKTEKYRAVVQNENGDVSSYALPDVKETGFVMHSEEKEGSLIVTLAVHPQVETEPYVYLFVHNSNTVVKAELKFIQERRATFKLDKADFPEGINHITIFDATLNPVCERLYCRMPTKKLSYTLNSNQKEYSLRRKVTIDVNAAISGVATPSNFSISVYKHDSLSLHKAGNIFEYLTFTSELQGDVESPDYYFNSNDSTRNALDNLMLTHGWRRFSWKDIFSTPKQKQFTPEYHDHIIRGKVVKPDGTPAEGVLTYLSSPGKTVRVYGSRSDAKGQILFEVKDFYERRNIIIQTNSERDSVYTIVIENPYSEAFSNYKLSPLDLSPAISSSLLARSIAMQVQDIYYEENLNRFSSASIDTTAFYGNADESYKLDDFTRFPVMEEVMREYVRGVMVRKRKDGFHFIVIDNTKKGVLPEDPLILLDGVPVFDTDKIMAYDPTKIKQLDVVMHKHYLGPLILPGVVSFSTYQGDLSGFELDPKALNINFAGLQRQREFYSPVYATQQSRVSRMPDQRNLLYWGPRMTTNKDGKCQIEFYTSDIDGTFEVVIQGITKDGVPGSGNTSFSVKRFDN